MIGVNPWVGCGDDFRLSGNSVVSFLEKGIYNLSQATSLYLTLIWHQEWKSATLLRLGSNERVQWEGYQI
jgi:hypothetical protein